MSNYNFGDTISDNGTYELTAKDKAGNTTTITFTINKETPTTYSVNINMGAGVEGYTFSPNQQTFNPGDTVLIYFNFSDALYNHVMSYNVTLNTSVSDFEHNFIEEGQPHYGEYQAYMTFTMPSRSVNVSIYGDKEYNIIYNLNDSTEKPATNNSLNPSKYNFKDESDIPLYPPSRDGYTFVGWTGPGVTTPQLELSIPAHSYGDLTYVANWEGVATQVPVTVRHYKQTEGDSYTASSADDQIVYGRVGETLTLYPKTFTGFTPKETEINYTVTSSLDQIVKFYYDKTNSSGQYTLEVEYNTGIESITYLPSYNYNDNVEIQMVFKDGYAKGGTYRVEPYDELFAPELFTFSQDHKTAYFRFKMPPKNLKIIFTISPLVYDIEYNMDGGTNHSQNPSNYTIESGDITLREPTRSGYVFKGWTGTNGMTPQKTVTIPSGSTGDRTYKANWELAGGQTEIEYTVIHYRQGLDLTYPDSLAETVTEVAQVGQVTTVPTKTYPGFDTPAAQNLTINQENPQTIRYYYKRQTFNVTASGDTSKVVVRGTGAFLYEKQTSVTVTAKTGYTKPVVSAGTLPNLSVEQLENGATYTFTMPANDVVFNFTTTPIEYNITYDLDGGINNSSNPDKYTIETDTFTIQEPTRSGYVFTGWVDENDNNLGKTPTISRGSTGDKYFKATWEEEAPTVVEYTVTHHRQGFDGTYPSSLTETKKRNKAL